MRRTALVVAISLGSVFSFALPARAQDASRPVIRNVTMSAGGEEVTIVGSGFGASPVVTIDGEPVAVLPGASETQITVVTPAALLTTPGSYRLTVVDPARGAG